MTNYKRCTRPKPVTIVVRIEKEQCDFLARQSRALGCSMSDYVRKVIRSYMCMERGNENKTPDFDNQL